MTLLQILDFILTIVLLSIEVFAEAIRVYILLILHLLKVSFLLLKPLLIKFFYFAKASLIKFFYFSKASLKEFFFNTKDYLKEFFFITKDYLQAFFKEHAKVLFFLSLILFFSCIYILAVFLSPYYILKYIWDYLYINYISINAHHTDIEFLDIAWLCFWPIIGYISHKLRDFIKFQYYYPEVDLLLELRQQNHKYYHIPYMYRPIILTVYTILLWHFLFFRH